MDPSGSKYPRYKVSEFNERFKPANDNKIPKALILKRIFVISLMIAAVVLYAYL
jgi:hypothetical protein